MYPKRALRALPWLHDGWRQEGSLALRFTLVELLVVMTIVFILAALLLPLLRGLHDMAGTTSCGNQFHQLSLCTSMYVDDNRKYPYSNNYNPPGNNLVSWDDLLSDYDGRNLTWAQKLSSPRRNNWGVNYDGLNALYMCPAETQVKLQTQIDYFRSYAINSGGQLSNQPPRGIAFRDWSVFVREIPSPATTLSLVEHRVADSQLGSYQSVHLRNPYEQAPADPISFALHNKSTKWNYLFCDGHVATLSPFETVGTGTISSSNTSAKGFWTRAPAD